MRSLFRYYGGKNRLAGFIVSNLPNHRYYREPCCGAGSVLFSKPRCYAEMINDLSGEIINYYRVIQNDKQCRKLKKLIEYTPFSRDEFDLAHETADEPVERARRMLIRSLMGYNADSVNTSNSKTGFRTNATRNYSTPAHDWGTYPDCIEFFNARLKGVVIENRDMFSLIEKEPDLPDALWYIDPPYPRATRTKAGSHSYFHEMNDSDHERLVEALLKLKAMVVLSGYETELYHPLTEAGWARVERKSQTGGKSIKTEILWLNPQAVNSQTEQLLQFD